MLVSEMLMNSGTEARICIFETTSFGIGLPGPALAVTANVVDGKAANTPVSLTGGATL